MTTRVCIADGAAVFRAGVRGALLRERDFDVFEVAHLSELERALDEEPDVVLIDAAFPPHGAAAAIAVARPRCPGVVVWNFRPGAVEILNAVRAGATGYLRKDISPEGLVRAVRSAARGESPLSRELTDLMIGAIHAAESEARSREQAALLSAREREVLGYLARGSRNKQIADALDISEFTVKRHVQNILQKLKLPSRHAAAAFQTVLLEEHAATSEFGAA